MAGVAVWIAAAIGTRAVHAADPGLSTILPRGGPRGTEVTVEFHGDRLFDAEEVLFYSPGLEATALEIVNGKTVRATLKVLPHCRLGEHSMRLRTRSGITDFRTFWVGPHPEVAEIEPNPDFSAPQPIELGVTVVGVITREDVDSFVFSAKPGTRISIEVEGLRLGGSLFDPAITVLDERRFVVASCDDAPLFLQDPVLSFVVPQPEEEARRDEAVRFVLQIRDSAFQGGADAHYRMHVGTFAQPRAVFPAGGKPGTTQRVRFLGDPLGPIEREVELPVHPERGHVRYGLWVEGEGAGHVSPMRFRLSDLDGVIETEPNGDRREPNPVGMELPVALDGIIAQENDHDWYRLKVKKGVNYEFTTLARRLGSPLDAVTTLHEVSGKYLAGNDDSGHPDSYFTWRAPEDGEVLLRVRDHLGRGGETWVYRIEVGPAEPRLMVTIPQSRRYFQDRQAIAVPRGNRFATLFRATRQNFGGPLRFEAGDLGAGLAWHADEMPGNQNEVPVVFEASADAPIGGATRPVSMQHTERESIRGDYLQSADFVRAAPNNSIYYRGWVDEMAVAVTEAVPYSIEFVQPKGVVARRGFVDLEVRVHRDEGFLEPVRVQFPYRPPGIGATREVTVPGDRTSGRVRVNANGGAEQRTWSVVAIARANVRGNAWVSTPLLPLEVIAAPIETRLGLTTTERGQVAELVLDLETVTPFEGEATARIHGLPAHCTAEPVTFPSGTASIRFSIQTSDQSRVGRHKSLLVRFEVPSASGPIVFDAPGRATLRIDPPRVVAEATPAAPKQEKAPEKEKPAKPLSRLEKLRREFERKQKGGDE